jgi:hypothetical protein
MSPSHASGWIKRYNKEHFGFRPFKRHGLVLTVAGICYILTGLTYVYAKPTPARKIALQIAFAWFPIELWGTVFVIVGALAVLSSRWPVISDSWGYALLTGLAGGWAATYAAGVMLGNSPISNLTGALQWGLQAFIWWAISGFVNPDKTVVVVITDDDKRSDS